MDAREHQKHVRYLNLFSPIAVCVLLASRVVAHAFAKVKIRIDHLAVKFLRSWNIYGAHPLEKESKCQYDLGMLKRETDDEAFHLPSLKNWRARNPPERRWELSPRRPEHGSCKGHEPVSGVQDYRPAKIHADLFRANVSTTVSVMSHTPTFQDAARSSSIPLLHVRVD